MMSAHIIAYREVSMASRLARFRAFVSAEIDLRFLESYLL